MSSVKYWGSIVATVLAVVTILYLIIACAVFDWRNPKANKWAKWGHIGALIRFERVQAFQE